MNGRIPSGIDRLDGLLGGGLPAGGINLLAGAPGSGKTILALQYVFENATAERPAVYLATVSEPFEKLIRYGQTLQFFDAAAVGRSVVFGDLAPSLEEGGLDAVLEEIERVLRERRPGLVVIDSFKPLRAYAADMRAFRSFLTQLAGRLSVLDVSTFWIGEYSHADQGVAPEFAVADTVITLEASHDRERTVRELRVLKLRGSGFASGAHAYRLSTDGLRVFPRLADVADVVPYDFKGARTMSGVPALDAMLGEGYMPGTTTLCAGPTGSGKTLIGLHFIVNGGRVGEAGLLATFQENPSQLRRIAAGFGWSFEDDQVTMFYRSAVDLYIDEWVYELLETVDRTGARRVMIDGIGDIARAARDEVRYREYIYSLIQRLSRQGVSLYLTSEVAELFSVGAVSPDGTASLCDNVVLLQYTNQAARIGRTLTVLKTRASSHQPEVREYLIDQRGVVLADGPGG